MQPRQARIPYTASRYQIRHRPWFCCDSFFTCIFLCSFRQHFDAVDGAEMANVEQTQKMGHSSRVKFSFVSVSPSWFLVSMYLIWILESRLIRSNNQSRATITIRSHKSSAGIPSILKPASKGKYFRFCGAVWDWNLFLTHPADWNKRLTSQNAQCSTWCRFWVLKISREIRVLKQSQSALFSSITHMTILSVFTCVMNMWNQSR